MMNYTSTNFQGITPGYIYTWSYIIDILLVFASITCFPPREINFEQIEHLTLETSSVFSK